MTPLFHYCTTATFLNIIQNKSIWLSSLLASNDTQEGKWLSVVLRGFADSSGLSDFEIEALADRFRWVESITDCLGFCLSSEGDMLSQWRGYANDATGVAVGFKRSLLDALSTEPGYPTRRRLHQVIYDAGEQRDLLASRFPNIKEKIEDGGLFRPTFLGFDRTRYSSWEEADAAYPKKALFLNSAILLGLLDILYVTKNPAFAEEKEWRFITDVNTTYESCEFRVRGNAIIPYMQIEFPIEIPQPIDCIILGPRNPTPPEVVKAFLLKHGLKCEVLRSEATYR